LLINTVEAGRPTVIEPDVKDKVDPSADLIFAYPGADDECLAWLDALEGKSELVVKPEQAMTVTKILEAIYESAKTGKAVYFS
jgi:predicted dehydrogenase